MLLPAWYIVCTVTMCVQSCLQQSPLYLHVAQAIVTQCVVCGVILNIMEVSLTGQWVIQTWLKSALYFENYMVVKEVMKEMFSVIFRPKNISGSQLLTEISYCEFLYKFHWFLPWNGNILGPPEYFHWSKSFGRIHSPLRGDWIACVTRCLVTIDCWSWPFKYTVKKRLCLHLVIVSELLFWMVWVTVLFDSFQRNQTIP